MHGKWTEKVKFLSLFSQLSVQFSVFVCLFWFVYHQSAWDEIKINKQKLKIGQKVDWKVTENFTFSVHFPCIFRLLYVKCSHSISQSLFVSQKKLDQEDRAVRAVTSKAPRIHLDLGLLTLSLCLPCDLWLNCAVWRPVVKIYLATSRYFLFSEEVFIRTLSVKVIDRRL